MDNFISSLVQGIPAIRAGLKGKNLKRQKSTLGQMQNLANAQIDPNSSIYQGIYNQERQAGQQDLASAIAEMSRQNRRLVSMGRTPLLDQERGGESMFRQLMLGQQDVGERARGATLNRIRGAGTSLSPIYSGYGDIADQELENKKMRVNAYNTIGNYLRELFKL